MSARLYHGDALTVLKTLPNGVARCCVSSPPYWGLRDYQVSGQLGLERTPHEYVAKLVEVFREVRRVLAEDGTLWLNMGDSYAGTGDMTGGTNSKEGSVSRANRMFNRGVMRHGCKAKDLVGIPWMVAFALRADGWWLRSDIIWAKPNPMPESVRDRPTTSHEHLFLLSRSQCYYYDAAAIAEPLLTRPEENYPERARIMGRGGLESLEQSTSPQRRSSGGYPPRTPAGWNVNHDESDLKGRYPQKRRSGNKVRDIPSADDGRGIRNDHLGRGIPWKDAGAGRNARSVWEITTEPYPGAHFATFPNELGRRCILAGSAPGDTVLDPFGGSGTTAAVAVGQGRNAIYIDLNPAYLELARQRIGPLLCEVPP